MARKTGVTLKLPPYIRKWPEKNKHGLVAHVNRALVPVGDELLRVAKQLAPVRSGRLRGDLASSVRAHGNTIHIRIANKGDSLDYFFQRNFGGPIPKKSGSGKALAFPPTGSFFDLSGGDHPSAFDVIENPGAFGFDKVFRIGSAIMGDRDSNDDPEVLFVLRKSVKQSGSHFADRAMERVKPKARKAAREAVKEFLTYYASDN